MRLKPDDWVVGTLWGYSVDSGFRSCTWEIFICKKKYLKSAKASWGWFDKNKVPFSCVDEWMTEELDKKTLREIFRNAKLAAQIMADEWNRNQVVV